MILSLLLSTSLEFNSILCGYKGSGIRRPGAIRHVFSHHAFTFPATAVENNPIYSIPSSGNLKNIYKHYIKAKEWANQPIERDINTGKKIRIIGEHNYGREILSQSGLKGEGKYLLLNSDSSNLPFSNDSIDFVVTDPPYYNSVQYSNLSEYFRVWLKLMLPEEANWEINLSRSAVSKNSTNNNSNFFYILRNIFQEVKRVLNKNHGRLIFTYHHWDPNAWAELSIALKEAGFFLINRYVVFSENPLSVHINGLNAIKHDTILVFSPNKIPQMKNWMRIDTINNKQSDTFCKECGEFLGWILLSNIDNNKIRAIWSNAINNRNHT